MFAKLLKYDIRSVWRLWWLLIPILPTIAFLMSIVIRLAIVESKKPEPFALGLVAAMIFIMLAYVALVGSLIYTTILVFIRFYKHLYTDEGYLTFTLPVKRSTVLFSKSVNAMIWFSAHTVLLVICALIIMLIAPPAENGGPIINIVIFKGISSAFLDLWEGLGAWLIVYIIEIIAIMALSTAFSVSLLQFCITFAAMLVKKAKLLLGIGIYYGANSALSSIGVIMFYVTFLSAFSGATELLGDMGTTQSCAFVALLLLIICTALSLFTSVFYMASRNCMERKLNLA